MLVLQIGTMYILISLSSAGVLASTFQQGNRVSKVSDPAEP